MYLQSGDQRHSFMHFPYFIIWLIGMGTHIDDEYVNELLECKKIEVKNKDTHVIG